MSWLSNYVLPKFKALVGEPEVPDNLWKKCGNCGQMIFHRDLDANLHVCQHCGNHMAPPLKTRLELLFDNAAYQEVELPTVKVDPLKFRDSERYTDRLKKSQNKTGAKDAITVATGKMGGRDIVIALFNFQFMGGSMGMAVGEGLVTAARLAVMQRAPLIAIPASGGARMQEGVLSLMQLPRTTIAVEEVKEAGLPFIVLLTNPTTGGVSASFAMLGDIHIAEPGAMIGFAGRRVIEQTVRETLPDGFQTAEYLLEHGMVDMVVPRPKLKATITQLLDLLCDGNADPDSKSEPEGASGTPDASPDKADSKHADDGSIDIPEPQKSEASDQDSARPEASKDGQTEDKRG